jgi:hypothetical protein
MMNFDNVCFQADSNGFTEIINDDQDFYLKYEWECVRPDEDAPQEADLYHVIGQGTVQTTPIQGENAWIVDIDWKGLLDVEAKVWACDFCFLQEDEDCDDELY